MYNRACSNKQCVVPENIHSPTTEGIGNSEGEGGQRPRKFQKGGRLYDRVSFQRDSRGPIQYGFKCRSGGVRHDPQRVLGKNVEIAHLPLVATE